jgi:SAM-dependent methyltransferase
VDQYAQSFIDMFGDMGVRFSDDEVAHLHEALRSEIGAAFTGSPESHVAVAYTVPAPGFTVNYTVAPAGVVDRAFDGSITVPAAPSLVNHYAQDCLEVFAHLGVQFSDDQVEHLYAALRDQTDTAFRESSRSHIIVRYSAPPAGRSISYTVEGHARSIEDAYETWTSDPTRQPSLFGTHPDARIRDLAAEFGDPADFPVLDIGAGVGRNSLALARQGHPVDAVEMTQSFAGKLHDEAQQSGLENLRVIPTDMSAAEEYMYEQYSMVFLSEVVSDFRTVDQVREVFELAARRLAPGGLLAFNIFLPKHGEVVSDAAREYGQHCYASIFTRDELAAAAAGLPLDLISDESVYDYEKTNLPAEEWPPTVWYERWTSGQDVFDVDRREDSPMDMRWLVYRKH